MAATTTTTATAAVALSPGVQIWPGASAESEHLANQDNRHLLFKCIPSRGLAFSPCFTSSGVGLFFCSLMNMFFFSSSINKWPSYFQAQKELKKKNQVS